MSRRTARFLALVLLIAGLCLAVPSPSRAATIESGWWWRANTGTTVNQPPAPPLALPVAPPGPPAPPGTEGGLEVSALPDGASAVAAVRVDQEITSLTLRVAANGDANGVNAKLVACKAATPWVPVAAGPWDAKPLVACDLTNGGGSVAGIRSADGSSWTFPVAPLSEDGKTDVVIVPLADSDQVEGVAAPFQLIFVAPTAADVAIAPIISEPSTDFAGGNPDTPSSFDDSSSNDSSFDPIFGGGFVAPGSNVAPLVTPALDENEQAPVVSPVLAATPNDDNASQLLGAAIVLLALGLFFWSSQQTTPPIHPLVGAGIGREIPVGEPQIAGLGRFARPRVGKPPPL